MRKSNALHLVGKFKDKVLRDKTFTEINHGRYLLDGFKLDEISVSATVYTVDDIDNLVMLLQIARNTLHTQGRDHGSSFMDMNALAKTQTNNKIQ